MSRTLTFDIAINGAFLTRRWEEPDNWMRLTRECGYPVHSFCFDVLDPFFSGEDSFLKQEAERTRAAADRYGVHLCDLYTGVATHRFHGLSHSDERARKRMREWISGALTLANYMGVDQIGGHMDAFSCEVLESEERTEEAMQRIIEIYKDICAEAGEKGHRAFYSEQMYIPSEVPWTLAQTERMLVECNTGNSGCPFRVALDVGHQAGNHYGLSGDDLSYEVWLRRFGAQSELIHMQQTTQDASHHWPFTDEYNAKGHIDVQKVIDAVVESHREWANTPMAAVLPAVDRHYLVGEFIPGSTKTEAKVLDELKKTAEYLRKYIPEGGLTVEI
ncbi:MAG: TIM barrel protein [Armatimonadaceae bacterium]